MFSCMAQLKPLSFRGHSLLSRFFDLLRQGGINTQNREVKFRTSCERIIPYEELNFGGGSSGPIKEVILGYSSALSVEAIRLLTLKYGDDAVVSRSEVPVR